MANSNGWGDGAANNAIGWGQGANNAIGWGDIHAKSYAGLTDIVGVSPFTGLLDTYSGASAAYSVRRLSSAYTGNLIRVRRSSDNTEQDIGYDSNNVLDTTTLLSFVGAGNGFVTTWYDQSGNANNGVQTTAANQPQIVTSGVVNKINSKPSLSFDGSNDLFQFTEINVGASNYVSFVGKRNANFVRLISLGSNTGKQYAFYLWSDNFYYFQGKTTGYQTSSPTGDTTTSQLLLTGLNNSGTMSMFKNSNTISSSFISLTSDTKTNVIGAHSTGLTLGSLQEVIFYNSNQSSNRTGIETNINTFYTIY
jgi:hypothetical protein